MSDVEAALAALDPDELVADLAALVRIPSVIGAERAVLEHLRDRAAAHGLEVALDEHDLEAVRADPGHPGEEVQRTELLGLRAGLPGGLEDRGRPRLAFCGHVDVVPPGAETWTHGPWSGVVDGGELHGRGSSDMKAGVVAALHALVALRRAGVEPGTDPVLLAVSSEEDGGVGAFAALREDARYDGCVVTEPTGFAVVCAQAGAITFRGEVPGVGAHAAYRREGVSAVDRYVRVHAALHALEARVNAAVEDALMAALDLPYPVLVGRVQAGEWSSTVPDRLVFEGRAPVRVGETVADAQQAVERAVADALRGDGLPPATVTWPGAIFASARTPTDHPLAVLAVDATARERGTATPAGVPWGADMRLFAASGVPTVMVGPRAIAIHGVDERVDVEEVVATARILVRIACGHSG